MVDPQTSVASSPSPTKPRIPYACEACRVAKVKCQPAGTADVCRRCSVSKRECIFKTGPRTRRRRSKLHAAAAPKTPPPSAPSKTFTIDVPMPADDGAGLEPSERLELLREAHEGFIDSLIPADEYSSSDDDDDDDDNHATPVAASSASSSSRTLFSASTPCAAQQSVHRFYGSARPQFNLDSAASLLRSFRDHMLPHFPVVALPAAVGVPELARDRPFVLLAVLAASSGRASLQGHSLYDDEFRKVLALKFVSGGERSVELLVGLLVYCAWYPFHLRPRSRKAVQYCRMAADLVHDLDLDQAPENIDLDEIAADGERMAGIRAYLGCKYMTSRFTAAWQKGRVVLPFQPWTATCCDILFQNRRGDDGSVELDQTLAWLVRLGHATDETVAFRDQQQQDGLVQNEGRVQLMAKGMEAQIREWQGQIPVNISSKAPVRMATMFAEIVLFADRLIEFPNINKSQKGQGRSMSTQEHAADPDRLALCARALRTWYDYLLSLPTVEFGSFTGVEWSRFVVGVVVGFRLSFALPPRAACRQTLGLEAFLDRFADDGKDKDADATTDVLSASRTVMGVVRAQYRRRCAAALEEERSDPVGAGGGGGGGLMTSANDSTKCPIYDASLAPYLEMWDDAFVGVPVGFAGSSSVPQPPQQPVVFHDLWATMTMGWSQEGLGDVDFGGV